MPEFLGGDEKLFEYLANNITYPKEAKEKGIQGKVYVQFIVEKDGSISDVKVIKGIGDGCDKEALRAINEMPRWKPGTQKGKPVRVRYNLPINYVLTDPEPDKN